MSLLFGLLFISSLTIAYPDPLTFNDRLIYFSPPYFQSTVEFRKASRYLLQRLPFEARPVWNSEARKNFGFGVIVGLAKELAYAIRPQYPPQRYQALQILYNHVSQAFDEYNYIVNQTKSLLIEADIKTEPVVNIIDSICIGLKDTFCDRKVHIIIKTARYLQPHAELLLQLGSVSKRINGFSSTFDSVLEECQEISFLEHHADDPYVRNLMKELYKTYSLIKNIN